ncbi:methyl-accepting chemotaxis sensory transducer with Pas/Pac sensor [Pseudooceanicola antarcticus]|uniref:Chemotaxis protein n=1 Tax=Pseudooceanicola antarcticus TaxID=1247613 RepID=A0A285IWT0_9RHOB|nr:methyl-accepting chemotaxis protein [Pseudooceanicola antarcticus]PJE25906.1 chemotaxis protein [Pseudooceanicola antarcticus]SNY52408.1 methyl-accepting chemotaxis sensory transducer with Pas/Pac sensor [Pseudooceanicola antarcticus]
MLSFLSRSSQTQTRDTSAEIDAICRSHLMVWYDMEGTILDANDKFCEETGYSHGEVVGKSYKVFVREKDHDLPELRTLWRDMGEGKSVNRIVPRLNRAGEEIWFDVTYTPVKGPEGGYTHVLSVAREISRNHFRRRDNRSQVDAVKRSMAVAEYELDGRLIDANELFLKPMGYKLEDVKGKHHRTFMDPEEAAAPAYADFWSRLRQGSSESGQVRRRDRNGAYRWLEATYETLIDPEGRPFKVVCYAFDTTDAKNLAADAASQIAAINRVQAVIEFDTRGKVTAVNDTFCAAMGYERDEIVGKHHSMFVDRAYAKSPEYETFWADLRAGRDVSGNFQRLGKGGRVVHIRASYNPIYNASGEVVKVVKYAIDTTALQQTVDTMQAGLDRLADGDLTVRLEQNLGQLDTVRQRFNSAVSKIEEVIGQVLVRSNDVHSETGAITGATTELSRRTEQQAATLQETAAALTELSVSVQHAAEAANEAKTKADLAKKSTEESGRVVDNAVGAMTEIQESSNKITSITNVIDDIAFQTNLLALNAGVEAARAGDAGRGFAVVAQEVRALAQRSSEAAREIAELISASTRQVGRGVDLVGQAGTSIRTIDSMFGEINDIVAQIAGSASEQARGISEMNTAVNQLDHATQENAAMAEETNAATQTLAGGIADVQAAVSFFSSEQGRSPARPAYRAAS